MKMSSQNQRRKKKKGKPNSAGAALALQLLKPVQFTCNSSANGSVLQSMEAAIGGA